MAKDYTKTHLTVALTHLSWGAYLGGASQRLQTVVGTFTNELIRGHTL